MLLVIFLGDISTLLSVFCLKYLNAELMEMLRLANLKLTAFD
jgi:uncharacterized protein YggT (Ycf19 family)